MFVGLDNDSTRNVVIFGVDNSSSSHTDNRNFFLVLGERPTFGINVRHGIAEQKLVLPFVKQMQNLA